MNEGRFGKKSRWPKALPGDGKALGRGGFKFTYSNNMNSLHPLKLENTDTLKKLHQYAELTAVNIFMHDLQSFPPCLYF